MLFLHLHLVLLGQGVPKCSSITFVIQWNNMVRRCIICAFWLLLYKLYSHVTLEERQNIFASKQQLLSFPLLDRGIRQWQCSSQTNYCIRKINKSHIVIFIIHLQPASQSDFHDWSPIIFQINFLFYSIFTSLWKAKVSLWSCNSAIQM